ncbi:hypothetical protein DTO96_100415 [Ephemeroptericola cinctiostellae]|uniref:Uncharacterized protein n=1 Tax=Ephemeroptericola cinctiostellae TaxID=2268024 RepID=A0A345D8L7_9BURK|nr:hypothetical protein [Ephemeroptericola cinctiostellae]AXF84705.1 hypothetical protein DTO96_100415 [Ephemeroptericola cinctiostellae]
MRLHKKFMPVIACAFWLNNVNAQTSNEHPYHIQRHTDGDNVMPLVSSSNTQADKRINDYLFIDALSQLATQPQAKKTVTPMPASTTYGYNVVRNDRKVLALNLHMGYCGAYCEESNASYHFDAQTGHHIGLTDVFTNQGIAQLDAKINQLNIARIERTVKHLKSIKRDDTTEAQLELYTDCLNSKKERAKEPFNTFYSTFQINNRTVTFTSDRCSNHAMRALDDIGDFDNSLSLTQLTPYLTTYGKALFSQTASDTFHPSAFGQILYGTLGNARITMLLEPPQSPNDANESSVSGQYFYNQYKTSIELYGSLKGNTITLTENDERTPKTITLTISDASLNGFWQGEGKSHPISVKP